MGLIALKSVYIQAGGLLSPTLLCIITSSYEIAMACSTRISHLQHFTRARELAEQANYPRFQGFMIFRCRTTDITWDTFCRRYIASLPVFSGLKAQEAIVHTRLILSVPFIQSWSDFKEFHPPSQSLFPTILAYRRTLPFLSSPWSSHGQHLSPSPFVAKL